MKIVRTLLTFSTFFLVALPATAAEDFYYVYVCNIHNDSGERILTKLSNIIHSSSSNTNGYVKKAQRWAINNGAPAPRKDGAPAPKNELYLTAEDKQVSCSVFKPYPRNDINALVKKIQEKVDFYNQYGLKFTIVPGVTSRNDWYSEAVGEIDLAPYLR